MNKIDRRFLHYETRAKFEADKSKIPFDSIVFVDEGRTIYTHGEEYAGIDLSEYLKQADAESIYAKKEDIAEVPTNVSAFTNDAGYLTEHQDLSAYALKTDIPQGGDGQDLSEYLKSSIAESTYAKKTSVYDKDEVDQMMSEIPVVGDITQFINNVAYDSTNKQIQFKHDDNVLHTIDATDFIKDGMVDSVSIQDNKLSITFNTDAGKEAIQISLTDIFNPDNYYTKDEVDSAIDTKQDKLTAGDGIVISNGIVKLRKTYVGEDSIEALIVSIEDAFKNLQKIIDLRYVRRDEVYNNEPEWGEDGDEMVAVKIGSAYYFYHKKILYAMNLPDEENGTIVIPDDGSEVDGQTLVLRA